MGIRAEVVAAEEPVVAVTAAGSSCRNSLDVEALKNLTKTNLIQSFMQINLEIYRRRSGQTLRNWRSASWLAAGTAAGLRSGLAEAVPVAGLAEVVGHKRIVRSSADRVEVAEEVAPCADTSIRDLAESCYRRIRKPEVRMSCSETWTCCTRKADVGPVVAVVGAEKSVCVLPREQVADLWDFQSQADATDRNLFLWGEICLAQVHLLPEALDSIPPSFRPPAQLNATKVHSSRKAESHPWLPSRSCRPIPFLGQSGCEPSAS